MKPLYIIKVGTTYPDIAQRYGDFEDWVRTGLAISLLPIITVDVQHGAALPDAGACSGVVITGSHEMVSDRLAWSQLVEQWIPLLLVRGVPLLGICYGHQLLAQAMGGSVGYHSGGSESGTVDIFLMPQAADDALFAGLPQQMPVHTVHRQTVFALPPDALLLARNDFEQHHAFRLGECAWGVQFHPEYDESVMAAYLLAEAGDLAAKKQGVRKLQEAVRPTPEAAAVLNRFGGLVERRAAGSSPSAYFRSEGGTDYFPISARTCAAEPVAKPSRL